MLSKAAPAMSAMANEEPCILMVRVAKFRMDAQGRGRWQDKGWCKLPDSKSVYVQGNFVDLKGLAFMRSALINGLLPSVPSAGTAHLLGP